MKVLISILTIISLVLVGCVPSLHGIAEFESSVMDQRLDGIWQRQFPQTSESDERGKWRFIPQPDERAYRLEYTDPSGSTGLFTVRLTKIGENHYLDLFPVNPHHLEEFQDDNLSGFYRRHLLPVHTFIRVMQWAPTLKLAILDLRRMDEYLNENPDAIAHERTDLNRDVLLTASTSELRQFIASLDGDQQLFTVPIILERE